MDLASIRDPLSAKGTFLTCARTWKFRTFCSTLLIGFLSFTFYDRRNQVLSESWNSMVNSIPLNCPNIFNCFGGSFRYNLLVALVLCLMWCFLLPLLFIEITDPTTDQPYVPQEANRGALHAIKDVASINASYERYLSATVCTVFNCH